MSTKNVQFSPARRLLLILILFVLFFAVVSLACTGAGACGDTVPWSDPACQAVIQEKGKDATNKLLFDQSDPEKSIQKWIHDTDPAGETNDW